MGRRSPRKPKVHDPDLTCGRCGKPAIDHRSKVGEDGVSVVFTCPDGQGEFVIPGQRSLF